MRSHHLIFAAVLAAVLIMTGCISQASPGPAVEAAPSPAPETPALQSYVVVNESQPLVKIEVIRTASTEDIENEWMYRTHGRYLKEAYRFTRTNVSGDKDLIVNISVYDYRFLRYYQESGAEDWGTNFWWFHPAPAGQIFLFVFVREEMEGTKQINDPRMWGFTGKSFAVQIGSTVYGQDPSHTPCIAIKQMEDIGTFNDEYRISDFGKLRVQDLRNGKTECQDLGWLRMGRSNQWDGYLIFVVPESAASNIEDIKVLGSFAAFGDSWWKLTERSAGAGGR